MSRDTPAFHLDAAQLEEIYDFALGLGRNAGKILLDGVEKRCGEESGRWQGQEEKDSAVDIVTQTDLGILMASYPLSATRDLLPARCRGFREERDQHTISKPCVSRQAYQPLLEPSFHKTGMKWK